MIVVTGAAGFIGSKLIEKLNSENFNDIIAVDKFDREDKNINLVNAKLKNRIDRDDFHEWLEKNGKMVEFVFHIGAKTDTTLMDVQLLKNLNIDYSKKLWRICYQNQIPFLYASSAATYGLGEYGYFDDENDIPKLKPLNPYGQSKQDFDEWALQQVDFPFFWVGLKFFNVYGPNESHKGRMASVVWHAYNQITKNGKINLFRSHNPNYKDGEQKRDFVYINDVVNVCYWLMHNRKHSGIYNLGTGKARTFLDLGKNIFNALNIKENIEFIDTPKDIREKYQYFTQAEMQKLRSIGYHADFYELEDGVRDYVINYLT